MPKTPNLPLVGIDIVKINRFKGLASRKRALSLFLTKSEQDKIPNNARSQQFLAGRFAAKEAVIKASMVKLTPLDFRITEKEGKPWVEFTKKFSLLEASCSISHEKHYAVAVAVVQLKNRR